MKYFLFFILVTVVCVIHAQVDRINISASNNITSMPVITYAKLFYEQMHPGLEFQTDKILNNNEKNIFLLSAHAGFYYHRFIHTSIWIFPSAGYERKISEKLFVGVNLGGGYAIAFEDAAVLKLNDEGIYVKENVLNGRSQFMGQLGFEGKYTINKSKPDGIKLFFQLKTYLQGVYVKNYVPLMPLNSLLIGISIPFNHEN
ncbi:MAG: hypothetical protein Kow0068_00490 [Marinilabiliales bacterium]